MSKKIIRIATRQSPLALWQANHVRDLLMQQWPGLQIEILPMVTSGDKFLDTNLSVTGGKGLFVKELEEALLDKRADLAVHSMKDVPAIFPPGLCLPVICTRDNPLDALISLTNTSIDNLPKHATVGTSSLRRQSQLLATRPDLNVKSLRGNVQTRYTKLKNGDYDAIILAAAGLERLEMDNIITEILSTEMMLPACGQGALGIECRVEDEILKKYILAINDPLSSICVQSERHVNALLGGNCHVPVAVYCTSIEKNQLLLRAKVATVDGKIVITSRQSGEQQDALALAEKCAQELLANGARDLLRDTITS